jgi:hypothetical protein
MISYNMAEYLIKDRQIEDIIPLPELKPSDDLFTKYCTMKIRRVISFYNENPSYNDPDWDREVQAIAK